MATEIEPLLPADGDQGRMGPNPTLGKTPSLQTSLGVLSPNQLDRLCEAESRQPFLIEGLLGQQKIGIVAGDSALGKTPLLYMLALCVAAGVPFLGLSVKPGRVLYLDLENDANESRHLRDTLVAFLGLDRPPHDFLLKLEPPENSRQFENILDAIGPTLVIIDSLRSSDPDASETNSRAGRWLKDLRKLARKSNVSFLVLHHMRKEDRKTSRMDLEDVPVVSWLQDMEGARALVNQTDVRIALQEGDGNPAALKMKWCRRVLGESALFLLERVTDDEEGEPLGYRRLEGAALLREDRRKVYEALPTEFTFTRAKQALGMTQKPTDDFLKDLHAKGLVERIFPKMRGKPGYRKIERVHSGK